MNIFVHVDSIYINLKYPKNDLYYKWSSLVEGVDHRTLKEGVAYDDVVIRAGVYGYKTSVWKGDIRAFLSPETDDVRGAGNGMGIWLQLGPKFINANGWDIQVGVLEFIDRLGVVGGYDANITRLDVAIDVLGLDTSTLKHDDFLQNWVGRSQLKDTHTDDYQVLGFDIGSRKSAVYLRIYDKVKQAEKINELEYWWKVWGKPYSHVTRIEWEVAPKEGNFPDNLTNFYLLDQKAIQQLLNYLLDWGRLAIPSGTDQVRSRWADAPLWADLRKAIKEWNPEEVSKLKRIRKTSNNLSPKYVRQFVGILSGAMARCNPEKPNYSDLFERINEYIPLEEIEGRAKTKGKRIQNLTQKEVTEGEWEWQE